MFHGLKGLWLVMCILPQVEEPGSVHHEAGTTAKERAVAFTGVNGVKLSGSVTIPQPPLENAIPGVVLVGGSGPTDRDGNQPGLKTDLLRQIAAQLALEGIASLRYDKRGQYASEGARPEEPLSDFTRWENYVGDAGAALAFLQSLPEVDGTRTAMIGHSEGGLLVLKAAIAESDERVPPAALVLLSTPGRRCDVVLREQLSRLLRQQQATPAQTKYFMEKNEAIMTAIKQTAQVPAEVPPGLVALYPDYLGNFLQSLLNFDGAGVAARYPGPVLVVSGAKDTQHQVELETAALSAALVQRGVGDHEVYIVPASSHNLKRVQGDNDPGIEGEIAPDALAKICSWIKLHTEAVGDLRSGD